MSKSAVLHSQGALLLEDGRTVARADRAAAPDPVQVLSEAVSRPGSALHRLPGTPASRPFDAQYWACWVFTVLAHLLMAYLLLTA